MLRKDIAGGQLVAPQLTGEMVMMTSRSSPMRCAVLAAVLSMFSKLFLPLFMQASPVCLCLFLSCLLAYPFHLLVILPNPNVVE